LKSQIATSSWGGTRKLPYAFTREGIGMLSSVLGSDTAIEMNIRIMRVFTAAHQIMESNDCHTRTMIVSLLLMTPSICLAQV